MDDQVLHLVVPGLLGPMPRLSADGAQPRFPRIESCLARADRQAVPRDSDRLLFELFGVPVDSDVDLPTAPLCYLADTGHAPASVVFHADPVNLKPDQDRLLLFDAPAHDLDTEQAQSFVAAFNTHFAAEGWQLSAPTPGRWYLHLTDRPVIRTQPMGEVVGRNIDLFLPTGPDASMWQQRLTEVQMLFHGLQANLVRETKRQLPVSSLWLHGGGALPPVSTQSMSLQGDVTPLLQGLTSLASEKPVSGRLCFHGAAQRAVWDGDEEAWVVAVTAVEALLQQRTDTFVLYPGNGFAYRHQPAHRGRFWRRRRPLLRCLLSEEVPL